jgi:hypothetical protein
MEPLPLRCDIVNHSPSGFAWGYSGSGPAQLAVAILADYFGCAHAAVALHQQFKFATTAGITEKHWTMTDSDIAAAWHKLCGARPWLDRLAIFEEGPIVQIAYPYVEHTGEFGKLCANVPHDASGDIDEIVLAVAHEVEISLYRDQVSAVLLTPALRPSE